MKRVVIAGGSGFFGGLIAERLRMAGITPIIASRTSGDLQLNVEDPASIKTNIKPRDLVIDAAGPFQKRTPALIDAARTIGFDVIDLSDSPEYTSMVFEREWPISSSGIRVLTACSALSTVTANVVKWSGVENPYWVRTLLLPVTSKVVNVATMEAFLATLEGGTRTFHFPEPAGRHTGVRVRTVDSLTIPRAFPSIRIAELFVDTGMTSANLALRLPFLRPILKKYRDTLIRIARRGGQPTGILGYEIASTLRHKTMVFRGEKTYMLAVLPAILAAISIANGKYAKRGLVPPEQHVDEAELRGAIANEGIERITA